MNAARPLPWPGIALALAAGAGMLIAGVDPLLVSAVMLLWIGSLWLYRPEPVIERPREDGVRLGLNGIRELIEQFSLPLMMLDRNRIVLANSEARDALGAHIVGQDARVALRHPEAIALLDLPGGGSGTIEGLTGPRSIWQLNRHPIDERYWLIELHNRSAEADISRAHTDFVANASHELRTPLASIIGYVETLTDETAAVDKKTARRFHETVLREARRLQALVSDLMSLSRVEAEKHERPHELVDFGKLVTKAAGEAAPPDNKERVRVKIAKAKLQMRGDAQQLEQLARNLVDNALKYGDADKPVQVEVSRTENRRAMLTVTDNGEGIAPEHLPHLTRRFYRTDPGRSRAAGGTGLGLAIVKHIVERHRGWLDIASRQGQGTTVTVKLPLVDESVESVM
jgi:two-component system phosphate regulon sensor histidine kinase PhoR